jgi:cytochrome b561
MANLRYSRPAIVLHWTVAVLVLAQIGLGFAADWLTRPLSDAMLDQHVRLGLLIFALMILRLSWRLSHRPPPMPVAVPRWRQRGARMVYLAFYLLLLLLPVTGYVLWAWTAPTLSFWGWGMVPILFTGGEDETWRSIAGYAHEYGGYAVTALVILHIAAALHHQFVARDMTIGDRMGLGPSTTDRPPPRGVA